MYKSLNFKIRFVFLTLFLCVAVSAQAKIPAELLVSAAMPSLAPMIERVRPSVVNIATQTTNNQISPLVDDSFWRRFFRISPSTDAQKPTSLSAGSGVIVDAHLGLILTSSHIVDNAETIRVTLLDGRSFDANLVGVDSTSDLALLQVRADNLIQIAQANSDDLRVGDFAIAIGNPFGDGQTVASGIISGLGRFGLGVDKYESIIQTDASINPGNSGGALVNLRGELIGINTAISDRTGGSAGVGFAIPVNIALRIKDHLIEYGEMRRGKIGIVIQDLGVDLAQAFGVEPHKGVIVAQVIPGAAAETAGLESGDIILRANGHPLRTSLDLVNQMGEQNIGESISLEVSRGGHSRMIRVQIEAPDPRRSEFEITSESLRIKGAMIRNRIDEPGADAPTKVVVSMVIPDSAAQKASVLNGDLILAVNRQKVTAVSEVRMMNLNDNEQLLLLIQRDGHAFWIVIP